VAEKLLQELDRINLDRRRQAVLQNYHLLSTRTRDNITRASQGFIDMLEQDKDYLPALLGMSISYILKRQPDKARNTLRMIAKMPYNQDLADEFEKSYLLLAELYVVKAKYDLAQELCRKCLVYNKSCGEAWDLMGRIMEKEQAFKDAADCYEKAWQLEHESSAAVGFKLAFNYLKAKRHVEAINICHKVLKQYPDYPRIREEILIVAQGALRPNAAALSN
jgi:tetratricopeptide repeat protein 21B